MPTNFQDSLSKLERLSPSKLDKTSRRIRGEMADAEWKMALCLLALKRSGSFRRLGFGTLTAYAERVLQLSGRKVGALLGAAEALEHLPLMSEAFRSGRVCWSKVRVMHGLATPETEGEWLDFAREHSSVEVERKVAMSPLKWKRHRALKASLAGKPSVSSVEVQGLLSIESVGCEAGRTESREVVHDGGDEVGCKPGRESVEGRKLKTDEVERRAVGLNSGPATVDDRPAPPAPPRTIRLVFELTPDQYALYEQAESRVRAQEGRRLPRAEVLKRMAESVLSQGTAKARARHQVLVHKVDGSDEAWYETERGVLPVASGVLEEALESQEILMMEADGSIGIDSAESSESEADGLPFRDGAEEAATRSAFERNESAPERPACLDHGRDPNMQPGDHLCDRRGENEVTYSFDSKTKRTAVPNSILRKVFARAGHRCECCGRKGGRLDVHHCDPVSEGGRNELERLELLCRACHTKNHERDFEEKEHWRGAREAALARAGGGVPGDKNPNAGEVV